MMLMQHAQPANCTWHRATDTQLGTFHEDVRSASVDWSYGREV